ncbi:ketopantoate reductase family protein [Neobacillus niacini]|uniref:ketopantoate reductase family protein n=1 Tax=Neobacillus niacini TaxID=86668 RepID=UPI0007ABDD7F|nr:ketopantoate reductase family protein [Neobacillus niacini]MEC1525955.1 ketopantoate reductase family protein [Neobacillus niacini]
MNILVVGAGALGVYFGGRMLEAGQNVSFFVREKRAAQLTKEGLKINSPEGTFEGRDITIFTSPEEVRNIDLVILAVKGYHLDEVIPQVQTIVQQTGTSFVLPLLNGIEHIDKLQQAIGKEKVLGGFASIIATLNELGHVEHTSGSSTFKFGILHEQQTEISVQLEVLLSQVKTKLVREENILKSMWKKYIFITAFSGITSAMQLPSGFIVSSDATFATAKRVILEMTMLAEQEGIILTDQEIESVGKTLISFKKEATSSMHQDLRKGLPIEVEHLHGGALRLAAKHQVEVPVIETLYGILKPYENGRPTMS